jgi:hypothetical protein
LISSIVTEECGLEISCAEPRVDLREEPAIKGAY